MAGRCRPLHCPRATRAAEPNRAAATPTHLMICHAATGERHRHNPGGRPMMVAVRPCLSFIIVSSRRRRGGCNKGEGRHHGSDLSRRRGRGQSSHHARLVVGHGLDLTAELRPKTEPRHLHEGRESGASAECGAYGSAYSWRGGRRQVMPHVSSTYSAGGGVGVGKCRFGGGSFILRCPFCRVGATSHNTFAGSNMKGFVGSDRKINASASTTVTSSYVMHLIGGLVLESDLPIFWEFVLQIR
jgi:hypothetical protein